MSGIYLRECLLENIGPIGILDITLPFNPDGTPKPLLFVGQNGSGKTLVLAQIADALVELAKTAYRDVVRLQQIGHSPFFKLVSGSQIRFGTKFCVSLLEFGSEDKSFAYTEKFGEVNFEEYRTKLGDRFKDNRASAHHQEPKRVTGNETQVTEFFHNEVVCFFPSSRHEKPHWFNSESLQDSPVFTEHTPLKGVLDKPIVVESTAIFTIQWLMDVMVDSLVDADFLGPISSDAGLATSPSHRLTSLSNIEEKMLLKRSRENIDALLRAILQDDHAALRIGYRNQPYGRLRVQTTNGEIPSLDHLSAGQSVLFNVFATIIRYADRADLNKSIRLHEIVGIVLIDEIDAHLHTSLQYEVLPTLCKLFPKIQFIITSHAPLFLLGMEKAYGSDGIQILEMPGGKPISTERFSEFKGSFECYERTKTFEDTVRRAVQQLLNSGTKPLVLTEGKIDAQYIKTALDLLGRQDLLDQLDVECIGTAGGVNVSGSGSGKGSLDAAVNFLRDNPRFLNRRVLLLYDHDTNKKATTEDKLVVRAIPRVEANSKMEKGIENLFPDTLFDVIDMDPFIREKEKPTGYVVSSTIRELDKQRFCDWMCTIRRNPDDFLGFQVIRDILDEFLRLPDSPI